MANVDAKFGLRLARSLTSSCVSQAEYSIAVDYTTAIFEGDVVELTGVGRNVSKAAAGTVKNIGVFKGCRYTDSDGSIKFSHHWPGVTGKTNITAFVIDNPEATFEVQADACAESEVGLLCDWNVGSGNTTTGVSGLYAVVSGTTATTGGSLRILRLVPREDNAYGAYAKIEVAFAEHAYKTGAAGAGGTN